MTKESFTEQQTRMIEICKKAGYGWEKFASNVEKQGFCSSKQNDTLCSMCQRIGRRKTRSYKHDISDCEAMSMGEYF